MNVSALPIDGLFLIEPKVFPDARGWFTETFHHDRYAQFGLDVKFVQDNVSFSKKGVLRGLHYQLKSPQGKLVQCIAGEVFDVAVDIRRGSPSFGQSYGVRLSSENLAQFWIPPGFAHGFYTLSETATVAYKCSEYYDAKDNHYIRWNDPDLAIPWPLLGEPTVSEADQNGSLLRDAAVFPAVSKAKKPASKKSVKKPASKPRARAKKSR